MIQPKKLEIDGRKSQHVKFYLFLAHFNQE